MRQTACEFVYVWSRDKDGVNAILLNTKIDRPKTGKLYGYKLARNWQNFTEIYFTGVKI